jgi:hypothetical protein
VIKQHFGAVGDEKNRFPVPPTPEQSELKRGRNETFECNVSTRQLERASSCNINSSNLGFTNLNYES